jgi:hypothetical protein
MSKRSIALALVASLVAVAAIAVWAVPPEAEARKRIVDTAQSFKGVPYVYGAESPAAFDCSGFVQYVYAHAADIEIPRNSKEQWAAGKSVDKSDIKPGDIFVFDTVGGGGPSHVAIYMGDDKIIHAISEGPQTGVVVTTLPDHYFAKRIIGARYFIISAAPAVAAAKPAAAKPPASAPAPAPAPAPVAPVPVPVPVPVSAPAPVAPAPAPAKPAADELPISQVGFVIEKPGDVFMDPISAATGTAIAFTITNGTGKDQVFHVFFYKADKDFSKTRILREDRQAIPAGSGVEIAPYLFTEPGVYRLNVKTADNTQLMQRTWKVVDLKR